MKRSTTVWVALACGVATAIAAPSAIAANRCVANKPGCFSTLQAALDAAHDGDTIAIAPGTYAGGVTADASVAIVGAGAGSTIVKGGGPVITIGVLHAASEPTVSITGVTITGGVATGDGNVTFAAVGGGVYIPGSAAGEGATVTIRNSVITGNRATPSSTVDSGEPCGDAGNCPYAVGFGGGIADIGKLTLINTTVSNNVAGGGPASSAGGGGIWTATNGGAGTLTLINSTVTGNTASVSAPNGQFASGGGIEVQDGETFSMTNSIVSNNTSSVTSTYPSSVGVFADSGGIHVGGLGTATIQGSRITGNVASANDAAGAPGAGSGALGVGFSDICVCNQTLVLKDTVISGNRTSTVGGDGSLAAKHAGDRHTRDGHQHRRDRQQHLGHEPDGRSVRRWRRLRLRRRHSADRHEEQPDQRQQRACVERHRVRKRAGSRAHQRRPARAPRCRRLEQRRDGKGSSGFAEGGGIWNGQPFGPDGTPTPSLLLDHTAVIGNALSASAGLTVQGGGLFTDGFPVSIVKSLIAHNSPDQCFGC